MKAIIDFHTHIFPDAIAQKAADHVGNYYSLPLSGNGTLTSLKSSRPFPDTRYVVFSAALNPLKTSSVNDYIYKTCQADPSLIGMGSVHVDTPNKEEEIERLISLGLKGMKFHPEFQGFAADDERMFPVYEQVSGRIPVLFHTGDPISDLSSPRRIRRVLDLFPKLDVIAAHMGGYFVFNEAEQYLFGTRAYFDTSNALRYMSIEQMTDSIRRHGVEKILFGSDFPLMHTGEAYEQLSALPLTEEEWDAILHKNAERLLGI